VSVSSALDALAETWDDTAALLPDTALQALASLDGPDASTSTATRALITALPAAHPVRRALAEGRRFSTGAVGAPTLARLSNAARSELLQREADRRLLDFPAVDWDELTAPSADLIRLSPREGPDRAPAFQFGPRGVPLPIVVEINRMLDAVGDPWGVADWWLHPNAWLNAAPATLIGHVDDALLLDAARAELGVG
jgi:hypothetical protein